MSQFSPDLHWGDALLGAILGVVFSGLFAATTDTFRRIAARSPKRLLLGPLGGPDAEVGVFLRGMFSGSAGAGAFVQTNEYWSREPRFAPQSGGVTVHLRQWVNIPEVIGSADVRASIDVIRLLTEANASVRVTMRSPETEWDRWQEYGVCIGGHFKTDEVLTRCEPNLASYAGAGPFSGVGGGFPLAPGCDYGLIYKGVHPSSGKTFVVVMGMGAVGTEAAAYFFRGNAVAIGSAVAARPFLAVIEAPVRQGREGGRLVSIETHGGKWRLRFYRALFTALRARLT